MAIAILTPFLLFGVYTFGVYEQTLLPQYAERAEVVARGIERRLSLHLFGSLSALRDVDNVLDNAAGNSPEIAFIAVLDDGGAVIAQTPRNFAQFQQLIAVVSLLRPLTAIRELGEWLAAGDLRRTARASGPFGTAELIRQTNRFIHNAIPRAAALGKAGGKAGGKATGLTLPETGQPTLWREPATYLIRLPLILFFCQRRSCGPRCLCF